MSEQYPRVTDDFLFGEDGNGVPQWTTRLHFTDLVYKTGTIEDPTNWRFEYIPGMEWREDKPDGTELDYWRIPQSLHRVGGMNIAAGYRKWQAGYRHNELIPVRKGERYLCRAVFKVGIGGTTNPQAIEWMWFVDGLTPAQSQWASYESSGQFGSTTEHLFVFSAAADGWIKTTFWGRSQWRDNTCDMLVSDLMILHVSPNYGGAEIGAVNPFPANEPLPEPDPTPVPVPTPSPTPAPVGIPSWVLYAGGGLIAVLLLAIVFLLGRGTSAAQAVGGNILEKFFTDLLNSVDIVTYLAFTVPVTLFAVELWKRLQARYITPLPEVARRRFTAHPRTMLLFVQGMAWAGYMLATHFGAGAQYQSFFNLATGLVTVLGPGLLGLIGGVVVTQKTYESLRENNIVGFSFRPEPKSQRAA